MIRYIGKRLLWMIPTVLGITIFIFLLIHIVPGDPASLIAGTGASPAEIESAKEAFGLNKPLYEQLGAYISGLFFHLDMGVSYATKAHIYQEIFSRIPRTLILGLSSMIIASVLGILLGITAAVHQNRWQDHLCMLIALVGGHDSSRKLYRPGFIKSALSLLLNKMNVHTDSKPYSDENYLVKNE